MQIKRPALLRHLKASVKRNRVTALIGPRQCGKTTLARQLVNVESINYFDLEDPASLARLAEPATALRELKGLIVIDEIQRKPELFPVIRVLADRTPLPAKFLVLGSASPALLRQSSESLAGRVETIAISGFSLCETGIKSHLRQWLRGGLPPSFLAKTEADSLAWRKNFIQTFIERDLHQWGIGVPPAALMRFWAMLAHYHGDTWSAAEPARALGISEPTVRHYLDILSGIFMVRQLQPWHASLKKRQVKAPKIYFRDTGLLHQMLGILSEKDLYMHPKYGKSWEGYIIEETIKATEPDAAYYWATHGGAELDLLLVKNGRMLGVECKRVDAPRLTPSMVMAQKDLKLEQIAVIYPGNKRYSLQDKVHAVPFEAMADGMKGLFGK
ncbi:MAG TPA: hypothetical protein DER10_00290 [Elusimicrobia bacterium]|nr:hypothetical protein [Elusimicrobiota bacterium]